MTTTSVDGDDETYEEQTISHDATQGYFKLTYGEEDDKQTTDLLPYDATAAEIKAALEGLSNIGAGDVTVTGGEGGPWTVTFDTYGDKPEIVGRFWLPGMWRAGRRLA